MDSRVYAIMGTPPPPSSTPHYHPAPYLSTGPGSFLSAAQLVHCFQGAPFFPFLQPAPLDFYISIEHVQSAPQLVFERLVANLSVPVLDSIRHARSEIDTIKSENETLQSSSDKLVAKVSELELKIAAMELEYGRQTMALQNEIKVLQASNDRLMAEAVDVKSASLAINTPTIGVFHTSEIVAGQKGIQKSINFTRPTLVPPVIVLALNSFRLLNNSRTFAAILPKVDGIDTSGFKISITGGEREFPLYTFWELASADFSWLELDPDNHDFQFGRFNINDNHRWHQCQAKIESLVKFPRAYSKPPQVVVWLNGFVLNSSRCLQVHTYASSVTMTDFLLHITTLYDKQVYMADVVWIAFPKNRPNVCSGNISKIDSLEKSGYVEFEDGIFTEPPRVVIGINEFTQVTGRDLELSVKTSNITASGMNWSFDSFSGAGIGDVGASFIALS